MQNRIPHARVPRRTAPQGQALAAAPMPLPQLAGGLLLVLLTAGALVLAAPCVRAQNGTDAASAPQNGNLPLPPSYRVSAWLGKPVLSQAGEQIGSVRDMVLDDRGRFRYVIIESKALTEGEADDYLIVPMAHFRYRNGGEQGLVLDAQTAAITDAPRFTAGTLPMQPLRAWETVVIAYWLPKDAASGPSAGRPADTEARGGSGYAMRVATPDGDMVYLRKEDIAAFERLDSNADGAISRDEAAAEPALAERFERIDTYGNGRISPAEFALFEPVAAGSEGANGGSDAGR